MSTPPLSRTPPLPPLLGVDVDAVVYVQPMASVGVQLGRRVGEALRSAGAGARADGSCCHARCPLQGGTVQLLFFLFYYCLAIPFMNWTFPARRGYRKLGTKDLLIL